MHKQNLKQTIGNCGLNISLPRYLHPSPIKLLLLKCSISLFEVGFKLRCFQLLSLKA
jgi:hypothetical protein